jgi:cobalt-zinc-cadmium efflux system protein
MINLTNNNEQKTFYVVIITAITMVIEIIFGITTKSMSLLSDGIHMGSHVLAIGLSWTAYIYIRKHNQNNSNKILSLAGYTSGLILLIFALIRYNGHF